jgi:hypothetical protein
MKAQFVVEFAFDNIAAKQSAQADQEITVHVLLLGHPAWANS